MYLLLTDYTIEMQCSIAQYSLHIVVMGKRIPIIRNTGDIKRWMFIWQCSWEVNIQTESLMYKGPAASLGKWPPVWCLLEPWKMKT